MIRNNLKLIDCCIDGWDCPDASICNENPPDTCPLYDDQFALEPDEELDNIIFGA